MSATLMTAQTLNAIKGWPQPSAVDFVAPFDATVGVTPTNVVPPGTVVHLNNSGNYVLGVGNLAVMPLFTFQGSNDPDVVNAYGGDPSADVGSSVPITPSGAVMALVAIGAYELVSTNYYTGGTYNPNTPLTADVSGGSSGHPAGQLYAGTIGTNMIVGLVSRGVTDNGYGHNALAFWPCPVFP